MIFAGDGLSLSPIEQASRLERIVGESTFGPDNYLAGGVVERLEQRFASILGKEQAVFFPPARWRTIWRCGNWRANAVACWFRAKAMCIATKATRPSCSAG